MRHRYIELIAQIELLVSMTASEIAARADTRRRNDE
jgi:hypothetical protein